MWDALDDLCRREHVSIADVLTEVDVRRGALGLTAATRMFVIQYWRLLADQDPGAVDLAEVLRAPDAERIAC